MKRLAILFLGGLFWLTASVVTLAAPVSETLKTGGTLRSYWLVSPEGLDRTKPAPLLMVLHGSAGSGEDMMAVTRRGFEQLAAKEKFVLVYPDALERRWNDQGGIVDDVGFLLAVVDKLVTDGMVDKNRVYATGISNGAMMAYRLACELPQDIAAIVPVSGTLALNSCPGASRVAVLHIHGSKDSNVQYQGGMGENAIAGVQHRSVPETLQMIANAHGCNTPPSGQALPDGSELTSWNCQGKAPLQLRLIPGGEHVWPGGDSRRNRKLFGGNFSASQAAWDFASQFKNNN